MLLVHKLQLPASDSWRLLLLRLVVVVWKLLQLLLLQGPYQPLRAQQLHEPVRLSLQQLVCRAMLHSRLQQQHRPPLGRHLLPQLRLCMCQRALQQPVLQQPVPQSRWQPTSLLLEQLLQTWLHF
jgi:hypothetical protein